jgi:hypothetical protein
MSCGAFFVITAHDVKDAWQMCPEYQLYGQVEKRYQNCLVFSNRTYRPCSLLSRIPLALAAMISSHDIYWQLFPQSRFRP